MQTRYSKEFKIEAVKKVLSRSRGTSIHSVARTLDIKMSTLYGWIRVMQNNEVRDPPTSGGSAEKSPYNWTAKEKFESIVEVSKLPQAQLAEYCRKKGIFPHHLEKWVAEFIESSGKGQPENISENKKLKNEIKKLNTELRRKDKALAEAAALLMLKKKAYDLWGEDEVN